jgi:hypothetical protein
LTLGESQLADGRVPLASGFGRPPFGRDAAVAAPQSFGMVLAGWNGASMWKMGEMKGSAVADHANNPLVRCDFFGQAVFASAVDGRNLVAVIVD